MTMWQKKTQNLLKSMKDLTEEEAGNRTCLYHRAICKYTNYLITKFPDNIHLWRLLSYELLMLISEDTDEQSTNTSFVSKAPSNEKPYSLKNSRKYPKTVEDLTKPQESAYTAFEGSGLLTLRVRDLGCSRNVSSIKKAIDQNDETLIYQYQRIIDNKNKGISKLSTQLEQCSEQLQNVHSELQRTQRSLHEVKAERTHVKKQFQQLKCDFMAMVKELKRREDENQQMRRQSDLSFSPIKLNMPRIFIDRQVFSMQIDRKGLRKLDLSSRVVQVGIEQLRPLPLYSQWAAKSSKCVRPVSSQSFNSTSESMNGSRVVQKYLPPADELLRLVVLQASSIESFLEHQTKQ